MAQYHFLTEEEMEQMARKFKPDGYRYVYVPAGENDSKFMKVSKSIAQDVECLELDTGIRKAQPDNDGCSGHECFFRRTGVRCSRCKT